VGPAFAHKYNLPTAPNPVQARASRDGKMDEFDID
jgi:hypothetical protein